MGVSMLVYKKVFTFTEVDPLRWGRKNPPQGKSHCGQGERRGQFFAILCVRLLWTASYCVCILLFWI